MADTKLSSLTALTGANLATNDKFYVDDVSAGASGSKSITVAELAAGLPVSGPQLSAVVSLSAAQLVAGTPVQVVAAQGANTLIHPITGFAQYIPGSDPLFPSGSDGLRVRRGTAGQDWFGYDPFLADYRVHNPDALTALSPRYVSDLWVQAQSGSDGSVNNVNKGLFVYSVAPWGGRIVTSSLNAGGAGYAVNDTLQMSGLNSPAANDLKILVTAVDGGGAVTAYTITNVGTDGFNAGNILGAFVGIGAFLGVAPQPGVGSGEFAINVLSINPGNGTVNMTVLYQVFTTA